MHLCLRMQPPSNMSTPGKQAAVVEGDVTSSMVKFGGKHNRAGIGGVFGVAECGAVFFKTAVPGSSCWEAMHAEKIRHGDVLFSVDGMTLYRAPLKVVAAKLLGPIGSTVKVVFRRGAAAISLDYERRMTNMKAAQTVIASIELDAVVREPAVSPPMPMTGASLSPPENRLPPDYKRMYGAKTGDGGQHVGSATGPKAHPSSLDVGSAGSAKMDGPVSDASSGLSNVSRKSQRPKLVPPLNLPTVEAPAAAQHDSDVGFQPKDFSDLVKTSSDILVGARQSNHIDPSGGL